MHSRINVDECKKQNVSEPLGPVHSCKSSTDPVMKRRYSMLSKVEHKINVKQLHDLHLSLCKTKQAGVSKVSVSSQLPDFSANLFEDRLLILIKLLEQQLMVMQGSCPSNTKINLIAAAFSSSNIEPNATEPNLGDSKYIKCLVVF